MNLISNDRARIMLLRKFKNRFREMLYYFFVKLPNILIGKVKRNLIYTHWGRGLNNFGDCLSPAILKYYGFTPVYSQYNKSDIILAGTILQWIPKEFCGIIFGSGGDDQIYNFPYAKIIGVRGENTKKNLFKKPDNLILGDPGLVMNFVFPKNEKKKYILGIVPHFVDMNHSVVIKFKNQFGNMCKIINPLRNPKKVIRDIKSCKNILSSSLHGLIIADAFAIPNARFVIRETMPSSFYDYKFHDYYSSLGIRSLVIEAKGEESFEYLISKMRNNTTRVKNLQKDLNSAFLNLKNNYFG